MYILKGKNVIIKYGSKRAFMRAKEKLKVHKFNNVKEHKNNERIKEPENIKAESRAKKEKISKIQKEK